MGKSKVPKVSVIVPVYKTEKYLRRCLDSVVNQTLEDIEVIIVNDASPDNSENIIKEYEEKDDRIVYIKHDKNLGLGGARNTGIKAAKSKYLGSVDSDDWIDEDMFEILYNEAVENDWDVVVCGFKIVNDEGDLLARKKVNDREDITESTKNKNIFKISNPAFWNKLWKKSLYSENNIFFPRQVYYQDLATTPRIYYHTKSIKFIEECPYNYVQRPKEKNSSATFSVSKKNIDDYFQVFEILDNFLKEKDIRTEYNKRFADMIYDELHYHISNVKKLTSEKELKEYYLYIIDQFSKNIEINHFVQAQSLHELETLIHFKNTRGFQQLEMSEQLKKQNNGSKLKFKLIQICKTLGIYDILKRIKVSVFENNKNN